MFPMETPFETHASHVKNFQSRKKGRISRVAATFNKITLLEHQELHEYHLAVIVG